METGEAPPFFYKKGVPPRSPYSAQFIEKAFNPKILLKEIKDTGFSQVKYYSHFGTRNDIIRLLNGFLNSLFVEHIFLFRI